MSEFEYTHTVITPDGTQIDLDCIIGIYDYGTMSVDKRAGVSYQEEQPKLYIKESVDGGGYFVETKLPIDAMDSILRGAENYYWTLVEDGQEFAYS